jgi:thymidine kinase
MFSGKSEELIRRLRRSEIARLRIQVFKHQLDARTTLQYVHAHSGTKLQATPVSCAQDLISHVTAQTDVIGIDEIQFFEHDIIEAICTLLSQDKRVIVAGLDLDFKMTPFGPMPILMALADEILKLKAVCMTCGKDAQFTQRLVNGSPAHYNDPVIVVGAQECYEARCRACYALKGLDGKKHHRLHL